MHFAKLMPTFNGKCWGTIGEGVAIYYARVECEDLQLEVSEARGRGSAAEEAARRSRARVEELTAQLVVLQATVVMPYTRQSDNVLDFKFAPIVAQSILQQICRTFAASC